MFMTFMPLCCLQCVRSVPMHQQDSSATANHGRFLIVHRCMAFVSDWHVAPAYTEATPLAYTGNNSVDTKIRTWSSHVWARGTCW